MHGDMKTWVTVATLPVIAVLLVLTTSLDQPYDLLIVGGVAVSLVMVLVPVPLLVFGWAARLPIWTIGPLPPLAFDGLRVLGAGIIFLRMWRPPSVEWRQAVNSWAVPIFAAGALIAVVSTLNSDSRGWVVGSTMLLGTAVGYTVVTRIDRPALVFGGYLVGASLSVSVLTLSAFGFTALSPQDNPGFDRLTGLAPSAPLASIELALVIVIAWAYGSTRSRWSGAGRALR